jgi:5'-3' exonuclease
MGVVVWPMVYFEADDALASSAAKAAQDERVKQVIICTPDEDLAQCVVGTRIVQLDRRRGIVRDEGGVEAKFGVKPKSIPDYLAVLGDTADGFPGVAGWSEKAAAATLSRYRHLEHIPRDCTRVASAHRWCTPTGHVSFQLLGRRLVVSDAWPYRSSWTLPLGRRNLKQNKRLECQQQRLGFGVFLMSG